MYGGGSINYIMRECNCLTTKPENPMDKSSYYVRNSRGSSRYNTVNKNNNTNMFTPTFSCRTTTRKMPAAFFICSLSFMLTICVSVASGDVLPSKWTIGEQLPQKPLPPHIEVSRMSLFFIKTHQFIKKLRETT